MFHFLLSLLVLRSVIIALVPSCMQLVLLRSPNIFVAFFSYSLLSGDAEDGGALIALFDRYSFADECSPLYFSRKAKLSTLVSLSLNGVSRVFICVWTMTQKCVKRRIQVDLSGGRN